MRQKDFGLNEKDCKKKKKNKNKERTTASFKI